MYSIFAESLSSTGFVSSITKWIQHIIASVFYVNTVTEESYFERYFGSLYWLPPFKKQNKNAKLQIQLDKDAEF